MVKKIGNCFVIIVVFFEYWDKVFRWVSSGLNIVWKKLCRDWILNVENDKFYSC